MCVSKVFNLIFITKYEYEEFFTFKCKLGKLYKKRTDITDTAYRSGSISAVSVDVSGELKAKMIGQTSASMYAQHVVGSGGWPTFAQR